VFRTFRGLKERTWEACFRVSWAGKTRNDKTISVLSLLPRRRPEWMGGLLGGQLSGAGGLGGLR